MQLKAILYTATLASLAIITQATHLPQAHRHLHPRQYGNDTAWASSTVAMTSTSLDTAIAATETSTSAASSSSSALLWSAWSSTTSLTSTMMASVSGTSSSGTDDGAESLNVMSTPVSSISPDAAVATPTTMLSSATYVYTMGIGSSQTVTTITTVITKTFTDISVCSTSFSVAITDKFPENELTNNQDNLCSHARYISGRCRCQ